jgi:hypothetical protein
MTNRDITQRLAALAGATLLLAGCGGENAGNDTNGSAEAAVGASAVKAVIGGVTGVGVSVSDLPDFAEVPSGANAIHNMAVNQDGKVGGSVTFETSQSPADLIAFYRASMARNGLKIGMETQSPQMVQMMGESEDKSKSLMVMIVVDDAGKASLNLVHSRTNG